MPEFAVPYRLTLQGTLLVDAETAEQAREQAEAGQWDDETFYDRAEQVDWAVTGSVREV
jgi:hypothetical protein